MKRKTCIICENKLRTVQIMFCGNDCYLKAESIRKNDVIYQTNLAVLLRKTKDNLELEFEVLNLKKNNIILKESFGFDSPFTKEYKQGVKYVIAD